MSTSTDTGYNAEGRDLGTSGAVSYTNGTPGHGEPRRSTETKASFKTTELMAYIAAVAGVLIASAVVETTNRPGHRGFLGGSAADIDPACWLRINDSGH